MKKQEDIKLIGTGMLQKRVYHLFSNHHNILTILYSVQTANELECGHNYQYYE